MSIYSTTSQMQDIDAAAALRRDYLDPDTAEAGDMIPYRDEDDDTDDQAWGDAEQTLARRDLRLADTGEGYVVCWLYARDGSHIPPETILTGEQPATAPSD